MARLRLAHWEESNKMNYFFLDTVRLLKIASHNEFWTAYLSLQECI